MNITRTLSRISHNSVNKNFYRTIKISTKNYDLAQNTQPQVKEEKFDFEDLKVLERAQRRKPKIEPFMKNIFVSIFDRELLAFPEVLNKEESEALDQRVAELEKVFNDPNKSKNDRIDALKSTKMFGAPVSLTKNGLAINCTESIKYLEAISSDIELSQMLSDHWIALSTLEQGLEATQYNGVVDDLVSGDHTISLCIKEKVAERVSQADFRTKAEINSQGIWRISGEKLCIKTSGYYLVLALVEDMRMKAFLVHPGADNVSHKGIFTSFLNTPATPLDHITETALAQTLGTCRLHAATLCRRYLERAMMASADYVKPRALSGKPLLELSTIQSSVGESLLKIYASESAEYFTAGLTDGYEDPDTEMEMAMCRNFMAKHGPASLLDVVAVKTLEQPAECARLVNDMLYLATRNDSQDSVNMFIALNGIHHAGKMLNQEIKQIRNPLFYPSFIFKKVFVNRHQEADDPKLTLHLCEHLHPSLQTPANNLEYCVLRMRYACETLMARHGMDVAQAYTELNRLAEAGTEILAMVAVLARASRAYCIGLRNADVEMKLAACFVEKTKEKVRKLVLDIEDGEFLNKDRFTTEFGRKVLENYSTLVENPMARTYW